jgi:hypothetical protein
MVQQRLFESRVEREFTQWIKTPDGVMVRGELVRRCRLLKERGWKHYGIAPIWEAIRYDASVSLIERDKGGWKLNNNHRSLLARHIMENYPDLRGFFDVRDLRGRVA